MASGQQEISVEGGGKTGKHVSAKDAIHRFRKKLLPGLKISLLFSLAIYVAMFIIGCLGVHKCPLNENIPLFLVISGAVGLLSKLVSYLRDRILKHFEIKYIESSLYTIEFAFFLLGTYWVYKAYKPSYDPEDGVLYCDKTAYLYAFIYITTMYATIIVMIVVVILLLVCCCVCASWIMTKIGVDDEEQPESQIPYVDEPSDSDKEIPASPAQLEKNGS